MTNEKIYAAIDKLVEKKSEIREDINRPTLWIQNPTYRAVCQKIEELRSRLKD